MTPASGSARCEPSAIATNRYIVHAGVPVPVPHTLSEFTSSPLLSLAGRLRLVKERFIPARREVTDESVDSFARRRFGDEVAERMFDPLVASTSAGDPRVLLARYAFPQTVGHEQRSGSGLQGNLRARMDARRRAKGNPRGAWSCAGGMQEVARQLADRAGEVRTGTQVGAVSARDGRLQVVANGANAEPFDAVIFAVPAGAIAGIVIDLPEADRLEQVERHTACFDRRRIARIPAARRDSSAGRRSPAGPIGGTAVAPVSGVSLVAVPESRPGRSRPDHGIHRWCPASRSG